MSIKMLFQQLFQQEKQKAYQFYRQGDLEKSLRHIYLAANLGYDSWFPFKDDELEILLYNIGKSILKDSIDFRNHIQDNTDVLLIASVLRDSGGHSEMIKYWLQIFKKANLKLAFCSTELLASTANENLKTLMHNAEKIFFMNVAIPLAHRIRQLSTFISSIRPKAIVLIINPQDVITVASLSVLKEFIRCPVIFVNHADHTFWLGVYLPDIVVEFREMGARYTQRYRNIKNNIIIPLLSNLRPQQKTISIRNQLKIPNNATLSLSVGTLYKILGSHPWSYVDVITELLKRNPTHHHLLILTSGNLLEQYVKRTYPEVASRFHILDMQPNIIPYYREADFLIETFPINGGMVRIEAMQMGLPIIVVKNPLCPQLSNPVPLPSDLPKASTFTEIIRQAEILINSPSTRERLKTLICEYYKSNLSYEITSQKIMSLIKKAIAQELPISQPLSETNFLEDDFEYLSSLSLLTRIEQMLLANNVTSAKELIHLYLTYGDNFDGIKEILHKYRHTLSSIEHNDIGMLYLKKGNEKEAIFHFQQAIKLDPNNYLAKQNLIKISPKERNQDKIEIPRWISSNPIQERKFSILKKKFSKLKFAIKIGTPNRAIKHWGDIYYAQCILKALKKAGHDGEVHYHNEWNNSDKDIDVVIHLRGLGVYKPKPYNINLMWLISHPCLVTLEELENYDGILVASKIYTNILKNSLNVPVIYLPQATDPNHFKKINCKKIYDIVFVGNNYNGEAGRQIIKDVLSIDCNLAIWGKDWRGVVPQKFIMGDFINWKQLPVIYNKAKIVLNDHHPFMKMYGFINNRVFDVSACEVFLISDKVKDIESEISIVTYENESELKKLIYYYLEHPQKRELKAKEVRQIVIKNHTFDHRIRQIIDFIKKIEPIKRDKSYSIPENSQSELLRFFEIMNTYYALGNKTIVKKMILQYKSFLEKQKIVQLGV